MADISSRQAAQELAQKILFESFLERQLISFFNTVKKDSEAFYAAEGRTIDSFSEFGPEMATMLSDHYRRVGSSFDGNLRRKKDIDNQLVDQQITNSMNQFADMQSTIRARDIMNTTQRDLEAAYAAALAAFLAENETVDNEAIARDGGDLFRKQSQPRPERIALTETQTAAEGAKQFEAAALISAGLIVATTQKQWVTILDNRTRESHVLADGQEVDINGTFIVGGERLRFPTDTSLGASAGNVINCRCASIVVTD